LNPNHLDDSLEDRSLEVSASGQTDADDSSARANVLCGLLEGLFVYGDEDDGVGTEAIWCGFLDVGDEVLGGGEVDEGFCAELFWRWLAGRSAGWEERRRGNLPVHIFFFSSPVSMAMVLRPITFAYWHASDPSPPPAPTIATN
jgi:hypothetical protein